MKKFLLYASAVSAMMLAGSCQKEVLEPVSEGEASVKFSIALPDGLQTKAMSQADSTDIVYYEIWNSDWSRQLYPVEEAGVQSAYASAVVDGCKATIDLKLVANQTYNFIFWAQNEACGAYDVTELKNVGVNYDVIGAEGNQDKFDAFYAVETIRVEGPINKTVTLYRPFAQLNFGADEMATDLGPVVVTGTTVTVTNLATVFNTIEGVGQVVDGNAATATFAATGLATDEALVTGGKSYTWVAMDYMLMMNEQSLVDVDAAFGVDGMDEPVTHSLTNVPLKKNYRTNIVGDLFTTDAKLQIIVDPEFNQPDMIIGEAWSRVDDFTYVINTGAPAGTLKAVLAEADAQARALATKADDIIVTIDLASDVDWVTGASHGSTPFIAEGSPISEVIINGNGNTLTATGAGVGSIRLANGGALQFNDLNIVDESVSYNEGAWELTYLEFAGLLSFKDCTFNSGVQFQAEEGGSLVASFEGCDFISNEASVYAAWVSDGVTSFEGCTFKGTRGLKVHEEYGSEVTTVEVDGCEFGPMSKKPGIAFGTLNAETTVIVKNSLFTDCQAGDQGLYIYETDTDVTTIDFTSQNNTIISTTDPVVQEDGSVVVPTAAALAEVMASGHKSIKLLDGTYTLAKVPAGLEVVGLGEDVVLDVQNKAYGVNGAVSFENVTIKYANANYKGFQHTSQESYKNCTIVGQPFLYGETVTFEGCTFEQESADAYNVWTYGAKNVTFDGCTFNCAGKSVLVYAEGSSNGSVVTFNGCQLNANAPVEGKAAIEIDSSLINGEYVVNINETEAKGFANGNVSGNSLWNNKKGDKASVYVDGTQVL